MCMVQRVGFKCVASVACFCRSSALALTGVLQAGNCIGDRGAEMIAEGLKVCCCLRELRLVRIFENSISILSCLMCIIESGIGRC